jgi:hypothetical protein
VILLLANAVAAGQIVSVAYTDPSTGDDRNAIQDVNGRDAATLTATAVTNRTSNVIVPPVEEGGNNGDDGDNISAEIENRIGDGNGDGMLDSLQSHVTSAGFLRTPTAISAPGNADIIAITLAVNTDSLIDSTTALTQVNQLDAPGLLPTHMNMPIGLLEFTATVEQHGASESFSLFLAASLGVNGYWKQDSKGFWANLASAPYHGSMVTENGMTRLNFTITDGGEFDDDGVRNGVIADPGAPAYMPVSLVGYIPSLYSSDAFLF